VHQQAQGIKVDTLEHQAIINQWQIQETECRKLLEADGLSNPKSVKQLQNYLRSKLSEDEVIEWPKTKNKNLATDKDSLSRLGHHPTLRVLAEFKTIFMRLANFGPKLGELLVKGELYPSYQIAGMVSGRFGCSKPNIHVNQR
jgi:DNA polymerase I-like protein with 3'-5' exonuclease and polymerase domains